MKEIYRNKNIIFSLLDEEYGFVNLKFINEAVMVIPVDDLQRILVIKQKRIGAPQEKYEFPSGGIKEGETALAAAERELNEETGYDGALKFIGSTQPLSGVVDLKVHIFLATDLKIVKNKKPTEAYEKITHTFLTVPQIKKIILRSRDSIDGYLLIGLSYFLMISKTS